MGFRKDVERLRQWANGATRRQETPSLPVPVVKEAEVDPALAAFDKGCAGKEAYSSRKAADAAQLYREQQGVPSQGMVAYPCRYCRSWHLGHPKPPARSSSGPPR
jgi:hypothetical protein